MAALATAALAAACFADLGQRDTDSETSTTGTSTGATTGATTGPPSVCGDGQLEPPELCDLGPLNGLYGACKDTCVPAVCGDGLIGPAEECDDGDDDPNDACLPDCTRPRCGDGFVAGDEKCDDGNLEDADECATTCREPGCGDGIVQEGETCDHKDLNADDAACTSSCQKAACGDGLLGPGEACEPSDGDATCQMSCALTSCTANTNPETGEECQVADADCTDRCLLNFCGDNFKAASEACDDGNLIDGDACSAMCQLEVCGDGMRVASEACDDGNQTPDDGCSPDCQRDARFIFVTDEKYTGALGNLAAADKKCQDSAEAKQLPGTYRAWLSFPGDPPAAHLSKSSLPYILPVTLEVVAANWLALVSGTLAHPIDHTADGTLLPAGLSCSSPDNLAWTHTRANGGPAVGNPCSAWIATSGTAVAGLIHAADLGWTEGCAEVSCAQALHLYCVEQ